MIDDTPSDTGAPAGAKRMKLRYAGTCRLCGIVLQAGTEAVYERATRSVRCVTCPGDRNAAPEAASPVESLAPAPAPAGTAGASARREYERRRANDEARIRKRWGRWLGGIMVALSDERQSTRVWDQGAVGEERLGRVLDSLVSNDIAALHDRKIGRTNANIDHLVVTRTGVWVIDAKSHQGRVRRSVEGWLVGRRTERLIVGRRDHTKLIDGVLKQVEAVCTVVGDIPVTGVLCFTAAEWSLFGRAFRIRGVHILWAKRLVKLLMSDQRGGIDVPTVRELLASRFQPALADGHTEL